MIAYLDELLKAGLSFVVLWAITRLLGKKQIGQLSLFDYINGITIGSLSASVVVEEDWGPVLLGVVVWGALTMFMHWINLKGRTLHRVADGTPSVVIQNGQIQEHVLAQNTMNLQELMILLRQAGYFNPQEVEFAILETNGGLSVMPKSQYRPVRPRDLGLSTQYEGLPIQVLHEGRPLKPGLEQAKLTREWLFGELGKQQVDPSDVYAAWLTSDGKLVVDRYEPSTRH